MAAHHLKIELDLVVVDLFKGEQNSPAFLELNPNHLIPVLEHGGFVLWESYAIMQYLADMTPHQSIYPTDACGRADVNRWLFWCGQVFAPGIKILNWENWIKSLTGVGSADPIEVARGERLLIEAANVLDKHLDDREWICDSGLSLADLAMAAPLATQHSAKLPIADLTNLHRWLKQVQALDSWKSTEARPH